MAWNFLVCHRYDVGSSIVAVSDQEPGFGISHGSMLFLFSAGIFKCHDNSLVRPW